MPRSNLYAHALVERFSAVMELVDSERRDKDYADIYTLMGCLFFAREKPYDPGAALAMRLFVKSTVYRSHYDDVRGESFEKAFMEKLMPLYDLYPGVFPQPSDIGSFVVPESVLDELAYGSWTTPKLPHEPREWKRKIRLSKGV